MKKIINYWFKPYICEYESNWSTQCYNRLWYLLGGLILLCFVLCVTIFDSWFFLGFTIFLFISNFFQLSRATSIYSKHCKYLYDRLVNSRWTGKIG